MKTITLVIMSLFLLGMVGTVLAAEESNDSAPVPTLYSANNETNNLGFGEAKRIGWFEGAMDKFKLAFTFNTEKKVNRSLEMAEKALLEIEAAGNDTKALERATKRYEFYLDKAEKASAKLEDKEKVPGNKSLERFDNMQLRLEEHRAKKEEIYNRALLRLNESNASAERFAKLNEQYADYSGKIDDMENKIIQKRENAQIRQDELQNKSKEPREGPRGPPKVNDSEELNESESENETEED